MPGETLGAPKFRTSSGRLHTRPFHGELIEERHDDCCASPHRTLAARPKGCFWNHPGWESAVVPTYGWRSSPAKLNEGRLPYGGRCPTERTAIHQRRKAARPER